MTRSPAGSLHGSRTLAPRVVRRDDGRELWLFERRECINFGLNAVVGEPPEDNKVDRSSYDDMRLGCYDVHERVPDMNRNGIFASMTFPSFPKFAGQTFVQAEDKELAIAFTVKLDCLSFEAVLGGRGDGDDPSAAKPGGA